MKTSVSPLHRRLRSVRRPYSELLYSDGLRQALDEVLLDGYDVLHIDQLWAGWAGIGRARTLLNIHHFEMIDWEDRDLTTLTELKAFVQMKRATHRLLKALPRMRMFTPRLLDYAKSINDTAQYWVVPFALDLSQYEMQPPIDQPVVGLIGSMHWLPSRSAGERLITRIWPLIKARVPQAKLRIAGWHAAKYLNHLLPARDVILDENLPHPSQFFSEVSVMAYAPSRGSGMKIKVLESMTYGVPVVTTWEGVEGIEYENGKHCWVEEDDSMLADRTCQLLENPAEREQMRLAARSLVEERYSPGPVVERMTRIYEDISAGR